MVQVETYEVEERDEETVPEEQEAEALRLISELGLGGQQALTVKKADGEEQRLPYQEMNAEEAVVYGTLFPTKTTVEKYEAGPIPVRVLQVIQHAKDLFETLHVWHPRVHNPDPILVGTLKGRSYLLARWGSALAPFKVLLKQARDTIREEIKTRAEETMSRAKGYLADLEGTVNRKMRGEWINLY